MTSIDQYPGFRTITPDDLRRLMKEHGEAKLDLIDMREPGEYRAGHLPGARLLPLSTLEESFHRIRSDKHTVLYCGTGKRSARAAERAADELRLSGLYSLQGGIMAWDGESLPDFPKLHVFDASGSAEEVLARAMELEKGAEQLYSALAKHFEGTVVASSLEKLQAAEVAHARVLHDAWARMSRTTIGDFDSRYAALSGDVLESGESYEDVINKAQDLPSNQRWMLLEIALDIELTAYDLYRNLAARYHRRGIDDVLLELASQEKAHYQAVLRALDDLSSQSQA